MSYRLEYRWTMFKARDAMEQERYVVAIEGGDNNVCHPVTGKRHRCWSVCMLGTATQVLKRAVLVAGGCEDGWTRPRGQNCSPEAYITRIRRLIEQGPETTLGCWMPRLQVRRSHPSLSLADKLGLAIKDTARYGDPVSEIVFEKEHTGLFWDFVDRFGDLHPGEMAEVRGLPAS